jgi:hypothetical protein
MKSKIISLILLMASATGIHASILVQELFDGISSGATLDGAGNTATSIGLTGAWKTNGSQGIFTADNFDVDGFTLPGLPSNQGTSGGVYNNTNSYDTTIYATRPLAVPINFNTDRKIFFSVRLNNSGATAMGIGLSTGNTPADDFVGAGLSWDNARSAASGQNEAGDAAVISYGTLNPTLATVNGTDNVIVDGPYSIRAFEPAGSATGYGLLVGRITMSSTGNDVIEIKRYAENQTIDNNLEAISWSAQSTFNSTMSASQLILWMNGTGTGELDAIRIGDTWTDVTGVVLAAQQPGLAGSSVSGVTGTGAQAKVNLFTSPANVTLYWDTVDQDTGSWANAKPLGNQPVGPVSGNISGLTPDTLYFYRFHAVNTVPEPDLEAWSEAGKSFATAPTGLAVSDLSASAFSSNEVDLSWSDNFNTEANFIVQRSLAGAGSWTTVATLPADTTYYADLYTGLQAQTAYNYRVIARNAAGDSNPSNVASATTLAATALQAKLLIKFDGSLDGATYTPAAGEIDVTGTFQANGAPTIAGGLATINAGNEGGADGFSMDPSVLGDLVSQNWVAEEVLTYQSTKAAGPGTTPVLMDVQGNCNMRLRTETDDTVLQLFYYNGSAAFQQFTPKPADGTKVHLAYAWDASSATLTGYINGVAFGSISKGPYYSLSAPSTVTFGYFGRPGFVGRGVDGVLDAVAFQSGSTPFNPASGFLILPKSQNFTSWIGGFPVGGLTGFNDDADKDGLANGLEAFLGSNPSKSNNSGIAKVSTNGTVTTFTHPMASPPLSDVTGSYEWSTDLVTWYAGDGVAGPSGGPTVRIPSVSPVAGIATVTATASKPMGKIFIRIKATQG